jgi:hypothetical protein
MRRGDDTKLSFSVNGSSVMVCGKSALPEDVDRHRVVVLMDGTIVKDNTGTVKAR